jgi:GlpG protein
MRRIGRLPDETLARRFCDYLLTLSIAATCESESDEPNALWSVWVKDEKQVPIAKEALAAFQLSPRDSRYQVESEAARVREQRVADELEKRKQHQPNIRSREREFGGLLGHRVKQESFPITIAIIILSVIASFSSNFGNPRASRQVGQVSVEENVYFGLSFVDRREYVKEQDAFASIRKGQIWRFVTPMFLHGNEMHLLFNMMWIYFLGSVIERLHGSLLFLLLVLGTEIAGMLLQVSLPAADFLPATLHGSPFAIGASGAVYGLFGFLWIRPFRDPGYPIQIPSSTVVLMMVWLVACMTPLIPNVANGAHLGGLIAGMLAAVVWRRR